MLTRQEFLRALRKAVPPTSKQAEALGGLLIDLFDRIADVRKEAVTGVVKVAREVGQMKASAPEPQVAVGDVPEEEGGAGEVVSDDSDDGNVPGVSTPIPAAMRAAMEAANVDARTGEVAPPSAPPPPASKAAGKKSGGQKPVENGAK